MPLPGRHDTTIRRTALWVQGRFGYERTDLLAGIGNVIEQVIQPAHRDTQAQWFERTIKKAARRPLRETPCGVQN